MFVVCFFVFYFFAVAPDSHVLPSGKRCWQLRQRTAGPEAVRGGQRLFWTSFGHLRRSILLGFDALLGVNA